MIDIRLSNHGDLDDLKKLWKLCFGDDDNYIELYYTSRYKEEETALLFQDGSLAAMLTMLPVQLILADESKVSAAMIYGVGTHPSFRNQGLSRKLMQFAEEHLQANNIKLTILVPATEGLFDFYRKLGYQTEFYIREVSFSYEDIINNKINTKQQIIIESATAEIYNQIRKMHCTGYPYVSYEDEDIQFQKEISMLSGGDVFSTKSSLGLGCFSIERFSEELVIIKDLLIQEELLVLALKEISKIVPANQYIVRIPPFVEGMAGGDVRAFGMAKASEKISINPATEVRGYLGLAFD